MNKIQVFVLLVCIIFFQGCGQQPSEASANLEKNLLSVLTKYVQACVTGDLDGFRSLRDPEEIEKLEKVLLEQGKTISSASVKPRRPENLQRILSYALIQTLQQGELARLAFLNENASQMGHAETEAEILLVVFKRSNSAWKVLRFGPMILSKAKLGPNKTFSEEKVPELFQLTDE